MAAPSFVGAGAGVTIASGSAACTAAGSGVAVGDLVILQVLQDGTAASAVTYSAISGIANLAGTASSLTVLATDQTCGTLAKQHLRVGRATSTTCSVTVATTGDDLYYRLYVFRDVNPGTTPTTLTHLPAVTFSSTVYGPGGTFEQAAQSFLAQQETLSEVRVSLFKTFSPTDNVIVEIQTNSGGAPSGTVVGTVATQAASALTGTATTYTYPCAIALPGIGTYWLVVRRSGARDTTNYVSWPATNAGTYADGLAATSSSGVWSNVTGGGVYDRLFGMTFGGQTLVDILENGTAGSFVNGSGATAAVDDVGVTTTAADRLAVQFVGVDDDNPLAAFTGMTGGTWAEAVAEFASATGTDAAIQLQTATLASAGTINGGAQTMAAADNWGVIGFALKPLPSGPATLFGVTASSYTLARVTAATKNTFATVAMPATFAAIVAGNVTVPAVTHYGQVARPFTFGETTQATRRAFGATAASLTFSKAVQASRKTFGVTAAPFTFGETTTGRKQTFGQTARPLTFAKAVQGTRRTFSTLAAPFTFGELTQARKHTYGIVTRPFTVAIATEGVSFTGAQTSFGATAAAFTFGKSTQARRKTFAQVAAPFTFARAVQGQRKTFGQVARPFTVTITATGFSTAGAVTHYGVAAMSLAFVETTQATRTTFGVKPAGPAAFTFTTSGLIMNAPILNYAQDIRWGAIQADAVYVGEELVWTPAETRKVES